jgi:hypothetical protein
VCIPHLIDQVLGLDYDILLNMFRAVPIDCGPTPSDFSAVLTSPWDMCAFVSSGKGIITSVSS